MTTYSNSSSQTITANSVLVGNSLGNVTNVQPPIDFYPLVSTGNTTAPDFSALTVAGGGTGTTDFGTGGLLYGATTTPISAIPLTPYSVISVDSSGNSLEFATPSSPGVALVSQGPSSSASFGTVSIGGGGTNSTAFTANSIVVADPLGDSLTGISLTDGELLIGETGGSPQSATLTASTNISITNGPGSITISSAPATFPTAVVSSTYSPAPGAVYYISVNTSSSPATISLPSFSPNGTSFIIKDSAGNASTNNISISAASGDNIDGFSSYTIATNYASVGLFYTSTFKWSVF